MLAARAEELHASPSAPNCGLASPAAGTRLRLARALGLLAVSWGALAQTASAQRPPPPTLSLVRIATAPVIDGRLDDPVWQQAARIDRLIQVEPVEGAAPSQPTEIRIAYDDETLYIGVRCWDDHPEKIIAKQMARDANLNSDDRISIVIDTFHDHRNAFFFQINPVSGRRDALVQNNETFRDEWNAIWFARSSIDAEGWTTEVAIPFQSLTYAPGGDTWGFNILRGIRRANETVRWAAAYQNVNFIDVSEAGNLEDIQGITQGLGLDVRPGLSGGPRWDRRDDRAFSKLEPSLDLTYNVLPSITAALTANTDFSEAAVDERRVNLTRFSLFFPETRQFFLQDAGIFDFGGLEEENGIPFFSRRIGIGAGGEEVPLRAGLKTTGRVGRWNFGLLSTRMGSRGGVENKELSVGRVYMNLFEESGVGVIATHGDPVTNGSNSLFGADLRLRTSRAFETEIAELNAWAQRSHTSDVSGEQSAWGVQFLYPNDRYNGVLSVREFQEDFRPALGFVNRTGVRDYLANFRYRIRPSGSRVRTIDFGGEARAVTDTGNDLETANVRLDWIRVASQLGDSISLHSRYQQERLRVSFEISPGVVIPAGRHDWTRFELGFETAASRPLQAIGSASYGDFFSGTLQVLALELLWRPSRHLFAVLEYEQNRARLDEGDFTTRIARARINVYFTPNLSWETFGQWDDLSDSIGINSQLRWIVEDGRELFLIWNQGADTSDQGLRGTAGAVTGKIVWTFRF